MAACMDPYCLAHQKMANKLWPEFFAWLAPQQAMSERGQSLPKRDVRVTSVCPSISDIILQRPERRDGPHSQYARPYRYRYAGLYNYRYAHPYRYRYMGYQYANPYRYQYAELYNYRYAHPYVYGYTPAYYYRYARPYGYGPAPVYYNYVPSGY